MWKELGISPTKDAQAIRKAYADRLRLVSKSQDKESFQRLRLAYERAIARAQAKVHAREVESLPEDMSVLQVEEADAETVSAEPDAVEPLLQEIEAQVLARNVAAALTLYERGLAQGTLPIGRHDSVLDYIMSGPVSDMTVDSVTYMALLKRVGWDQGMLARGMSRVRSTAMARLEAETWFKHLVDIERGGDGIWAHIRRGPRALIHRRRRRRNIRLLLKAQWQLPRVLDASLDDLKKLLTQYRHYEEWLKIRAAPKGPEWAEAYITFDDQWGFLIRGALWLVILIPVVAGVVLLAISGVGGWLGLMFFAGPAMRRLRRAIGS
jgi:hypothetical protein